MKTHTCSLLWTTPKHIHTNMKPIYTNANSGVVVICMHICIYMHISIPPCFPHSLGSYIVYRNTWLGNEKLLIIDFIVSIDLDYLKKTVHNLFATNIQGVVL